MNFSENEATRIIVGGDMDQLIASAQSVGQALAQANLSSNQIRNIFTEVRRIESVWAKSPDQAYRSAALLQPKLAYAAARAMEKKASDDSVAQLSSVLTPCLKIIQSAKQPQQQDEYFRRFVHFFEAILAYHKQAEEERKRQQQGQRSQGQQFTRTQSSGTQTQRR